MITVKELKTLTKLAYKYLSEDKDFILDEDEVPKNAVKSPVLILEYI